MERKENSSIYIFPHRLHNLKEDTPRRDLVTYYLLEEKTRPDILFGYLEYWIENDLERLRLSTPGQKLKETDLLQFNRLSAAQQETIDQVPGTHNTWYAVRHRLDLESVITSYISLQNPLTKTRARINMPQPYQDEVNSYMRHFPYVNGEVAALLYAENTIFRPPQPTR